MHLFPLGPLGCIWLHSVDFLKSSKSPCHNVCTNTFDLSLSNKYTKVKHVARAKQQMHAQESDKEDATAAELEKLKALQWSLHSESYLTRLANKVILFTHRDYYP